MPRAQTTLKFENSADSLRRHLLPHTFLLYPFTQAPRRKLNASGKMKTCLVTPGLPTLVPFLQRNGMHASVTCHTPECTTQRSLVVTGTGIPTLFPWETGTPSFPSHFQHGRWLRDKSRNGRLIRRWRTWSNCSLPSCWEKHLPLSASASPCGVSKAIPEGKGGARSLLGTKNTHGIVRGET